jgi:hypothetical protein
MTNDQVSMTNAACHALVIGAWSEQSGHGWRFWFKTWVALGGGIELNVAPWGSPGGNFFRDFV